MSESHKRLAGRITLAVVVAVVSLFVAEHFLNIDDVQNFGLALLVGITTFAPHRTAVVVSRAAEQVCRSLMILAMQAQEHLGVRERTNPESRVVWQHGGDGAYIEVILEGYEDLDRETRQAAAEGAVRSLSNRLDHRTTETAEFGENGQVNVSAGDVPAAVG